MIGDPTTTQERLYYYTLDLSYGIQSYIFNQQPKLQDIDFNSLSESEQETYRLFKQIIFNDDYTVKLNAENKSKLKQSSQYYWQYFEQIQNKLNVQLATK